MRWRPPTPGQPIEPGPPLRPAPDAEPTPPDTPDASPAGARAADAEPTLPDSPVAPDAPPPIPESSPMSDDTRPAEPDREAARLDDSEATLPAGTAADSGRDAASGIPRASGAPEWFGDLTLLDAFWRYERALMTNDVPELDELFARSPLTVRSEAGSALVGHDEIAQFRASRPPVPQRYLRRVHLRPIDANTAVIVAESVRGDNGTGSQTQLWQRPDAGSPWAVTVAHVSTVPGVQFGTRELSRAEERAIWATSAERRPLVESRAYPGAASGAVGQLAGIRVAVKDLFAIAGETIGAGNPAFAAGRAPETHTAPAVQALIDVGAEITGLAQTDELAFSIAGTNVHYGTPPNPAAPGRISGGSTSGPASAVALGLADLGLGTDTAGSIRVPGSYTGLYGLRTTHDAVLRAGLVGLAPSFDTVGLLARDLSVLERGVTALLATGERMPGAPFASPAAVPPAAGEPHASDAAASVAPAAPAPTDREQSHASDVAASVAPAAPAPTDREQSHASEVAASDAPATPYSAEAYVASDAVGATGSAGSTGSTPSSARGVAAALHPDADAGTADTSAPAPITGILVDPSLVALADADAQLTFQAALRALALNSGLPVRLVTADEALPPDELERWFDAFRVVQQHEAWIEDGPFVTANPDALDPAIAARFAAARGITDEAAADARATLARATAALEALVPAGTALALPSTSSAAPSVTADPAEIDRVRAATLRLTCLASLSGLPALTLPYGRVGTLPIGLCLIGSRGADLALLAAARPRA